MRLYVVVAFCIAFAFTFVAGCFVYRSITVLAAPSVGFSRLLVTTNFHFISNSAAVTTTKSVCGAFC